MSEARTGKRFPLELPIHIHQKKGTKEGTAVTADVSAAGVYIMADTSLAVGSPIEFDITMPASVLGTPQDVEVRCIGRVVRSVQEAKPAKGAAPRNGVACVIDEYKFIRKRKGKK